MCSNANDLSDYESEGRGFESLPAHQGNLLNGKLPFLFYIHYFS